MVSELRRPRPHGAVLDWIADVAAEQLFVSAVTVGEIQEGIEISRMTTTANGATTNLARFQDLGR